MDTQIISKGMRMDIGVGMPAHMRYACVCVRLLWSCAAQDPHYTPEPQIGDTQNENPSLLLSSFGLLVP